jgi:hypothetical protein
METNSALDGNDRREQYLALVALYIGVKELDGYGANMANYYFDCGIPACTCAVNLLESIKDRP